MAPKLRGKFLVQFVRVGRSRLTWSDDLRRPISDGDIIRALKKRKALMSREIDVAFGDSDYHFLVLAGGRTVGRGAVIPSSDKMTEAEARALADTYVKQTTALMLTEEEEATR